MSSMPSAGWLVSAVSRAAICNQFTLPGYLQVETPSRWQQKAPKSFMTPGLSFCCLNEPQGQRIAPATLTSPAAFYHPTGEEIMFPRKRISTGWPTQTQQRRPTHTHCSFRLSPPPLTERAKDSNKKPGASTGASVKLSLLDLQLPKPTGSKTLVGGCDRKASEFLPWTGTSRQIRGVPGPRRSPAGRLFSMMPLAIWKLTPQRPRHLVKRMARCRRNASCQIRGSPHDSRLVSPNQFAR